MLLLFGFFPVNNSKCNRVNEGLILLIGMSVAVKSNESVAN
jgi:hypothetical protein